MNDANLIAMKICECTHMSLRREKMNVSDFKQSEQSYDNEKGELERV